MNLANRRAEKTQEGDIVLKSMEFDHFPIIHFLQDA